MKIEPANLRLMNSFRSYRDGGAMHKEYLCDEFMYGDFSRGSAKTRLDVDLNTNIFRDGELTHPLIIGGSDGSASVRIHRELYGGGYLWARWYKIFEVDSGGNTRTSVWRDESKDDYKFHSWIYPFGKLNLNGRESTYPGPGKERTFNDFIIPLSPMNDRKIILSTLYDPKDRKEWEMVFYYSEYASHQKKILSLKSNGRIWEGIEWKSLDEEMIRLAEESRKVRKALPRGS